MEFSSWLWPDRTIGKRESRELREEHNRLVNAYVRLQEVLDDEKQSRDHLDRKIEHGCTDAFCCECDE